MRLKGKRIAILVESMYQEMEGRTHALPINGRGSTPCLRATHRQAPLRIWNDRPMNRLRCQSLCLGEGNVLTARLSPAMMPSVVRQKSLSFDCHSGLDKPAPYLIRGNPVPRSEGQAF